MVDLHVSDNVLGTLFICAIMSGQVFVALRRWVMVELVNHMRSNWFCQLRCLKSFAALMHCRSVACFQLIVHVLTAPKSWIFVHGSSLWTRYLLIIPADPLRNASLRISIISGPCQNCLHCHTCHTPRLWLWSFWVFRPLTECCRSQQFSVGIVRLQLDILSMLDVSRWIAVGTVTIATLQACLCISQGQYKRKALWFIRIVNCALANMFWVVRRLNREQSFLFR